MNKKDSFVFVVSSILTVSSVFYTNTPAFAHGGGGGGFRGAGGGYRSAGGYQGGESMHAYSQRGNMGASMRGNSEMQHSVGQSHGYANNTAMSHQNFSMPRHVGIPNRSFGNVHSGAYHNSWNGYHGYAYWNRGGWGPYWNNGWFYGAAFGTVFAAALFFPPWYYQPYYYPYVGPYIYPQPVVISYDNSYYPNSPLMYQEPVNSSPLPARNEVWITIKNGRLPLNAVVNNKVNNRATYYCRAKFEGKVNYGVLIPHDGCYIEKQSLTMRFTQYDVLVLA